MADEPAASQKPKRRLKSVPQTMRERAEKTSLKQEADQQKAARKLKQPKAEKVAKPKRKVFAPLRAIWRPIRWVGRHIIPRYFRSAFHELRLTTWPNRKQSRQLTTAVVMFAVIFGAVVSLLDYGLDKLFKELLVK